MNIYEACPELETGRFMLRQVRKEDASDLLKVYSDPKAVPLFNSDNCSGDDFHYRTLDRMAKAIDFWAFSYEHQYFVRWSLIDKQVQEAVGTVEAFRREAEDAFTDTVLLRLDLRSDYENEETLYELLFSIAMPLCGWFECGSITTKAAPVAAERRAALKKLGYLESGQALAGHRGEEYRHYFVLRMYA